MLLLLLGKGASEIVGYGVQSRVMAALNPGGSVTGVVGPVTRITDTSDHSGTASSDGPGASIRSTTGRGTNIAEER